ncbi:MAG: MerR family transcriptional regulator [Nitrospira sp.]|nr:MerR family transcriptional regulator [Nitrospira sp.]
MGVNTKVIERTDNKDIGKEAEGIKAIQVCQLFDISKATLFRWEREGVIARPARDWRNWRLYTRKNVDEIEKVICGRKRAV